MDQLWSFILLVVCALALALLSVSVICVYDNHCCVRLSVQLCVHQKQSKVRQKKSLTDFRHPPPLMLNKNLVVDNIWLRM